jgi:hypothetical protein
MRIGDMGEGSRRRLWRLFLFVAASIAAGLSPVASALNALGLAFDPAFGTQGFVSIPRHTSADPSAPITPVGMVHLPAAGGYVALSLQTVSGNARMVLSRFTDAGALDTGWGVNGNQLPGLPVPYMADGTTHSIRLVAGQQSGQDVFYLAFSLNNGGGSQALAVAKFTASGAFAADFGFGGYAASTLPTSAPLGLREVRGAAFTLVFGAPVLVVVVAAPNNRLVFTRAHGAEGAALSDQGGGSSIVFGANINVFQMRANGPNHVEILGSAANDAFYADYDAGTLTLASRVFRFGCTGGTSWAAVDALEHPAAFNGDALVISRAQCSSGETRALMARITNIATAPSAIWQAVTGTNLPACTSGTQPCTQALLAYDENLPHLALVVTPQGELAPVRTADGSALPRQNMAGIGGPAAAQPSTIRGAVFRYPRLIGFGTQAPATAGLAGLRLDGLFADGFD